MKIFLRVIVALLAVAIAAIVALYFVLKTSWGVKQARDYLNANSDLYIGFSGISHRWSSWDLITLNDLQLGERHKAPWLVAKTAEIGLSLRQLIKLDHPQSITVRDGRLVFNAATSVPTIRTNTLRLENMQVTDPIDAVQASGVNATLTPLQPQTEKRPVSGTRLQVQAATLTRRGVTATHLLAQGNWTKQGLTLKQFSAQVAGGSVDGALQRSTSGEWHINNLRLTALRLQTDKSLDTLFKSLTNQPLKVDSLTVENARLEGREWAVTDLNLTSDGLVLTRDGWQNEGGKLTAQASEAVFGSVYLQSPEVTAAFTPSGLSLRKISSGWEKGTIAADGQWLRHTRRLDLNHLMLNHIEYTLPADWKTALARPLPGWMSSMTVQQLTASRNLLIDIDASFPWQITALNGQAQGLQLVRDGQWGIWQGSGNLSALAATFNRTDVVKPALTFKANGDAISLNELTGIVDKGQLEATATIGQSTVRQTHLVLHGRGIAADVLANWGWPEVKLDGPVNLELQASGSLAPGQPLRPSVDATFEANGNNGKTVKQVMRHGEITP